MCNKSEQEKLNGFIYRKAVNIGMNPMDASSYPQLDYFLNGQFGWICPKCGSVMAPHMNYCIKCYSTGTTAANSSTILYNTKEKNV